MGDEDRGAAPQDHARRLLDLHFCEGVNAGGGFIQDEDGWLLHEHPHQRDELPLAHGKPCSALAHVCLQTLGQCFQPLAAADLPREGFDLGVRDLGAAVADVFHHAPAEEERQL